jgi:hypothetical protein
MRCACQRSPAVTSFFVMSLLPQCVGARWVWIASWVPMRIKQYVYFALTSERVTAGAMAEHIGLTADRVSVRGSTIAGPRPKPFVHSWEIVCDTAGLTPDEQIERVLDRIRPYQQAIRECVTTEDCSATLQLVRSCVSGWLRRKCSPSLRRFSEQTPCGRRSAATRGVRTRPPCSIRSCQPARRGGANRIRTSPVPRRVA